MSHILEVERRWKVLASVFSPTLGSNREVKISMEDETDVHKMKIQWKVDRELANHSLSSTASQGTSNIPFPWFLMLGCNSQAQVFIFLSLAVGTIRKGINA